MSPVAALLLLAAPQPVESWLDYDRELPLDLQEAGRQEVDGVLLRDVSFRSPRGGRVTAYLIEPEEAAGERAGLVFVHWGQGNRTEFVSEAIHYAQAGAISLLLDAPHMRPEFEPQDGFADPEAERDTYAQLVIDIRRGFDLLLEREEVNPERLGYVGHSLGATWGGALAGVEKRVAAFVLMGGLPNLTDPERSYPEEMWKRIRARYTEEQLERYREVLGPMSPERLVGAAPAGSVFFQFARFDRFISDAAAKSYHEAAREPEVRWYQTSHEFNDPASREDRVEWLSRKLRLER